MSTLFKNADILIRSEEGKYSVLKNAFLGVRENKIDYIGCEKPQAHYAQVRNMSGKLLMPGLVNAHGHSAMTLVRGAGSGLPLDRWLNEAIFPIEAKMTPADIAIGDTWACMEMIASGTTQVADMYDFPFAGALTYANIGMKVNLCRVGLCFDPSLEPEKWERTAECIDFVSVMKGEAEANAEALREIPSTKDTLQIPQAIADAVKDERIIPDLCLHSEYLTTEKFVKAISEANSVKKARVHVHVSETEKEHLECIERTGKTPVAYLEAMGILDQPTYMAHCVWCTDEDFEIMARKGATLVHNPSSNLKLGSGIARIADAVAAGVNVALGTDGTASNNNLNMFEEMHIAALLQKGIKHDPTALTVDQILDMATVNGAKALGRPDTGSLKVGNKADIIALDMNKPHLVPAVDIPSLLVYSAQGSDVVMTMIDGQIVYEFDSFTAIDEKKAREEFDAAVKRLMN